MEVQDYIDELVSNWPEFTGEQINTLTELLKQVRINPETQALDFNAKLI